MFKRFFKKKKKEEEVIEEVKELAITEEVAEEEPVEEVKVEEKEEVVVEETSLDESTKEDEQEEQTNLKETETVEEELQEVVEEAVVEEVVDVEEEPQSEEVQEEVVEEKVEEPKISLFERLKQGLSKAKQGITDRVDQVLKSYTKVDEDLIEEIEEILITADVGVDTTMNIIDKLTDAIKTKKITDPQDVKGELKLIIEEILTNENSTLDVSHSPTIIIMVGVNGVGKTTTIGKLASRYKKEGKKVLIAAGDTFRAAAIDQLEVWANRSGVDIIKHQEGADPGAVIFDSIKAAKARNTDLLICDTAGRLHNKANLMNELSKVFKIIDREYPEAKKEVLLVVDATTGQNAVSQAKSFKQVCNITGLVLTKLDGTAKGGVVLAVKSEVDVPVKLIGVGEKLEDLQDFDAKAFSDALFG